MCQQRDHYGVIYVIGQFRFSSVGRYLQAMNAWKIYFYVQLATTQSLKQK